jgi:hypothetical protein
MANLYAFQYQSYNRLNGFAAVIFNLGTALIETLSIALIVIGWP